MWLTIKLFYQNRCEALNVELSKSQKKIIKRVTTFLKNGEFEKNQVNTEQIEREPIMKYELGGNLLFNLFILLFFFRFCVYIRPILHWFIIGRSTKIFL